MDRTSVKVLRYIKKNGESVRVEQIVEKFGSSGTQSLSMLCSEDYLSRSFERADPLAPPCNIYYMEPKGRGFLQRKFWDDFDRWITRAAALIGLITGAASLILHLIG